MSQRCVALPWVVSAIAILSGCGHSRTNSLAWALPPDIRSMVTGNASRLLGADGLFATTAAQSEPGRPVINPARASELALAYMQHSGPFMRNHVESLHGAPVDLTALTAESRVVLAESPYESLESDLPAPHHKAFGSYYLVTLRAASKPVVTIAVSVYATDVETTNRGLRPTGPSSGNEFRTWVISRQGAREPRLAPEHAVALAFQAFRVPVTEAPRFIRAGYEFSPHLGRWHVRLSRSVRVTSADQKEDRSTDVLYVSSDGGFSVPADVQAKGQVRVRSNRGNWNGDRSVAVRPGLATSFITIIPP